MRAVRFEQTSHRGPAARSARRVYCGNVALEDVTNHGLSVRDGAFASSHERRLCYGKIETFPWS
jgi:hypothetical protein